MNFEHLLRHIFLGQNATNSSRTLRFLIFSFPFKDAPSDIDITQVIVEYKNWNI